MAWKGMIICFALIYGKVPKLTLNWDLLYLQVLVSTWVQIYWLRRGSQRIPVFWNEEWPVHIPNILWVPPGPKNMLWPLYWSVQNFNEMLVRIAWVLPSWIPWLWIWLWVPVPSPELVLHVKKNSATSPASSLGQNERLAPTLTISSAFTQT